MKLITFATAVLLATTTTLHAAPPHFSAQPLPPNTLLNNNGLIPIPPSLLQSNVVVTGVNDAGEFCGDIVALIGDRQQTSNAFVYLPTPAHDLPAGFNYTPYLGIPGGHTAINNNGHAAGNFYEAPYLWSPQAAPGISAGLNYLPTTTTAGPWAFSTAINDSGQVVGYDMVYPGRLGQYTPFVWSPAAANNLRAGMTYITTAGSTQPLTATAINNDGVIVGEGNPRGFLFAPQSVDGIPQGKYTINGFPHDINDSNQVVGSTSAFAGGRAFLWTPFDGLIDLNTLIPPNSGWLLTDATQINNRGDIIGTGTYLDQPASFFLTIPEPTLLSAIFLPTLLTHRRPRR